MTLSFSPPSLRILKFEGRIREFVRLGEKGFLHA
jgi:hypothetical protein